MIRPLVRLVDPSGSMSRRRLIPRRISHRETLAAETLCPHLLRKSVGTLVASKRDLDRAAWVLGHASTAVTERLYMARSRVSPDVRDVLQEVVADRGK